MIARPDWKHDHMTLPSLICRPIAWDRTPLWRKREKGCVHTGCYCYMYGSATRELSLNLTSLLPEEPFVDMKLVFADSTRYPLNIFKHPST